MNLETLQAIATAITQEREVDSVLQMIVRSLAEQPDVALARIWLIDRGDICDSCPMRGECPDQTRCLHLTASAGRARKTGEEWAEIKGEFRRFPMNVRKVGVVGATGKALLQRDLSREQGQRGAKWVMRPEWIRQEKIESFGCQPLIFRGEILGVIAVFRRAWCSDEEFRSLRLFADQAAVAIANARAFEEVRRLQRRLQSENNYLREEVGETSRAMIGESAAFKQALSHAHLVAPTKANVLILGESGTGKELIARAIHEHSQRRRFPLIKVNCASVPRELFESEFFGHVRGAFTGAVRDRTGRFQLADGGTLFLDEVGEIPLELQSKLLRVLQEGEFERVGEDRARKVNVRIIAATNRDLKIEIAAGRFREDLYYRMAVFPINLPPLRQRREDIPLLAAHFIKAACIRMGRPSFTLSASDSESLRQYDWPGNIRELQNVIERAVVISTGGALRLKAALGDVPSPGTPPLTPATAPAPVDAREEVLTRADLKRRERDNILAALEKTNGKVYGPGGAAELLGMKPTTLAARMKALGIRRPAP
jgi:transcriptional regulator with GAF, ATPase, and Fis domain